MSKHIAIKAALALVAPGIALLSLATAASASPNGARNVSFSASSDGASAQWSSGVGSPIDLAIGTTSGSFALIALHHLPAAPVSGLSEPTFATDNYNAGSPRYYITLSDGKTLWGYPPNSGLNGSDFAWAINNGNTYMSWTAIQAAEGSATVTGAFVIEDADQGPLTGTPGTDVITGLTFGANHYN